SPDTLSTLTVISPSMTSRSPGLRVRTSMVNLRDALVMMAPRGSHSPPGRADGGFVTRNMGETDVLRLSRAGRTAKRLQQEGAHELDQAEVAQFLLHVLGAAVLQRLPDFLDDHLGEMAPGAAELLAKRIHPDGTAGERRGPRGQGCGGF